MLKNVDRKACLQEMRLMTMEAMQIGLRLYKEITNPPPPSEPLPEGKEASPFEIQEVRSTHNVNPEELLVIIKSLGEQSKLYKKEIDSL